tara:strand:- start:155 stop:955 length:801 start_codon:yes stop_codon:yes gene_type:complete
LKIFDHDTKTLTQNNKSFVGKVSENWNIGGIPNGGYLLSIVSDALAKVAAHPDPFSISASFMNPGIAGEECRVEIDVLKTGRSTQTISAKFMQNGSEKVRVTSAYGDLEKPLGITHQIGQAAPEIPSSNDCLLRTGDLQGIELSLAEQVEVRLHPEFFSSNDGTTAESLGWVRFCDNRAPDPRALILFCDVFPPSAFKKFGILGWVPTIEISINIIKKPAPGWIVGRFRTDSLSNGRVIESGSLWDSTGQHVAQSRQLGLIMSRDN